MKKTIEVNAREKFLISKDNNVIEVSKDLLRITGYTESELVGKTLIEVSNILRIDSQINLPYMEDLHNLYIFNKEGLAIDVTLSFEFLTDENVKIYYFKENVQTFLRYMLMNFEDLNISGKQALAIYSYPDCICLKINEKYNENLNAISINGTDPLGKPYPDEEHIAKLTEEGYFDEDEIEFIGLDELTTYWDLSLKLIDRDENKKYILMSLYDVSSRAIEKKLNYKKKVEMELVLENISDIINIVNSKGELIHANKAAMDKLITYIPDVESLDDKMHFDLSTFYDIDGNELAYEDTPIQRVLRGETIHNEIVVITSNLNTNYYEYTGIPIYDDLGNIHVGIITARDIGDRIKAEEARFVKTQYELLNKAVEALELDLLRCTYPNLEITSINDKGFNALKQINSSIKSMDQLIGKSYFLAYPIDEETKIKELEYHLIKNGEYSYIDYSKQNIDGEERFFKTINQAILGLNNKVVEVIFITIDITDEVKEKNTIEETLKMQNQMFSTISHELKTPLSVIFSASQLIEVYLKKELDETSKEDISKNIDIIKQNCYRFTKLINNIIDLSKMESGFYKVKLSNENIIEIIEDIVDSVRAYVENKGLSIIFDTETEEKIIAVDADKIERIILNLISNAIKFSNKGGNIYIEIKDKVDFIEIHVRDGGIGINKKHLDTIFGIYKKVDNTLARNAEGSGIGLALVKTMVELLGGEISVESELGKGSLFIIKLPASRLDEYETATTIEYLDDRIEKMNIEFSDIYNK